MKVFLSLFFIVGFFVVTSQAQKSNKAPPTKEEILSKSYYEPKKTAQELSQELNNQMDQLQAVCSLKKNQSSELKKRLEGVQQFLKTNLMDPYMIYEYKLEFGGFLTLIEEVSSYPVLSVDSLDSNYRLLYALPEDTKPEDYYHEWARNLRATFKCVEQGNPMAKRTRS